MTMNALLRRLLTLSSGAALLLALAACNPSRTDQQESPPQGGEAAPQEQEQREQLYERQEEQEPAQPGANQPAPTPSDQAVPPDIAQPPSEGGAQPGAPLSPPTGEQPKGGGPSEVQESLMKSHDTVRQGLQSIREQARQQGGQASDDLESAVQKVEDELKNLEEKIQTLEPESMQPARPPARMPTPGQEDVGE